MITCIYGLSSQQYAGDWLTVVFFDPLSLKTAENRHFEYLETVFGWIQGEPKSVILRAPFDEVYQRFRHFPQDLPYYSAPVLMTFQTPSDKESALTKLLAEVTEQERTSVSIVETLS